MKSNLIGPSFYDVREYKRPSDFRPEAVSGTQGWTPRQQAIVGLVETIISALIGLIGTILTVLASGSGP